MDLTKKSARYSEKIYDLQLERKRITFDNSLSKECKSTLKKRIDEQINQLLMKIRKNNKEIIAQNSREIRVV